MRLIAYRRFGLPFCSLLAVCGLAIAGCGTSATAKPVEPATSIPHTATPVPTATVVFDVAVATTSKRRPTPTATVRPTPFVAPKGPYLTLSRSHGSLVGGRILIRGGHLPPRARVQLMWTHHGHGAPLSTVSGTSAGGILVQRYTIPAAQPGTYHIVALVNGARYASTAYHVESSAAVNITVSPNSRGDRLRVSGVRFVPHMRLLFAAYPVLSGRKSTVLGTGKSDAHGRVSFSTSRRLDPGEYSLHVFSTERIVADLAQAYFQVVV